jgi:hypothetical protein
VVDSADELEVRAAENAKTLPGWTVEKQRQYEQFLQDERLEYDRCRKAKDEVDNIDMAVVVTPILEQSPPDPWQAILSNIENLPNDPEGLERSCGRIKIRSTYVLTNVLGIPREKIQPSHMLRLARVMVEGLGWDKPGNINIGPKVCKGYWRSLEDM